MEKQIDKLINISHEFNFTAPAPHNDMTNIIVRLNEIKELLAGIQRDPDVWSLFGYIIPNGLDRIVDPFIDMGPIMANFNVIGESTGYGSAGISVGFHGVPPARVPRYVMEMKDLYANLSSSATKIKEIYLCYPHGNAGDHVYFPARARQFFEDIETRIARTMAREAAYTGTTTVARTVLRMALPL
jgi:hypothetical protein